MREPNVSPSTTVLLLGIMALKLSLSPGPERPRESDQGLILGLCSPGIVVQVALRERTGCVAWQWLARGQGERTPSRRTC